MRLEIDGLAFDYSDQPVLREIDFTVHQGDILGLVGPNGSGKSTLIKCINQILAPDLGRVLVDGTDVDQLSRKEIAKEMGYVAQSGNGTYATTVFDTVLTGRKPYVTWQTNADDHDIVSEILDELDISDLALRNINNLSGGQQQKVMIGRALAQMPDVLLLDEPTSDLDIRHQLEVLDVIREEVDKGLSSILAIHDLNLAARYSDKIVMLKDGKVYETGGTELFTRENIREVYGVDARIERYDEGHPVIIPQKPADR